MIFTLIVNAISFPLFCTMFMRRLQLDVILPILITDSTSNRRASSFSTREIATAKTYASISPGTIPRVRIPHPIHYVPVLGSITDPFETVIDRLLFNLGCIHQRRSLR